MSNTDVLSGSLRQYDAPDWQPLYDLIGVELADWFMWMHEIELADGAAVHAYKHIATRRYIHLAHDGRAFAYTRAGRYRQIDRRDAIDDVFERWEELLLPPEDPEPVRLALRRARRAARRRPSAGDAQQCA